MRKDKPSKQVVKNVGLYVALPATTQLATEQQLDLGPNKCGYYRPYLVRAHLSTFFIAMFSTRLSTPGPYIPRVHSLDGHRFVVHVCDSKTSVGEEWLPYHTRSLDLSSHVFDLWSRIVWTSDVARRQWQAVLCTPWYDTPFPTLQTLGLSAKI